MKKIILILMLFCAAFFYGQNDSVLKSRRDVFLGNRVNYGKVVEDDIEDNKIYNTTDVKPEFPGGKKALNTFIKENLLVPKIMIATKKDRVAYVGFVVEKDGSMTNLKLIRDAGFGTKDEVLRVVKSMPNWIPATQNGKPVRCNYSIDVRINEIKH